ncbi:Protein FAM63A [Quillaja saponaria]|uniref:Protein FAM63A n=1 Tax=Quillaja saponaria TaxID=32244 RepID=A0AAD7P780_QUISA|nr:Protein FAM63A [Quillaja saponaria]
MASSSSPIDEQRIQEEQQQKQHQQRQEVVKELMHKTKLIQFLGRSTPIVLQNDNGPCPLLAICNVLLLRNNLTLAPDITEVSQEKLLSLIAERLIDSNSNVDNKDAGYVKNQQQNIADAIDLLPRLATGIDVNTKFTRIDDFEFTPECAVFDLLDIPLYHGWIVDPQDHDTANAIGSKSYNALTGELVALEAQNMDSQCKNLPEEDSIDFAAATTATLGVPSPGLSKARSFGDSPRSISDNETLRKGNCEEEAEFLRVLKLSEADMETPVRNPPVVNTNGGTLSVDSDEISHNNAALSYKIRTRFISPVHSMLEESSGAEKGNLYHPYHTKSEPDDTAALHNDSNVKISSETTKWEAGSLKTNEGSNHDLSTYTKPDESIHCNSVVQSSSLDTVVLVESEALSSSGTPSLSLNGSHVDVSGSGEEVQPQPTFTTTLHESTEKPGGGSATRLSCLSTPIADSDLSGGRMQENDAPKALTSNVDGSEPLYEGEECVLDTVTAAFKDQEPVYEGEVVIAKQSGKSILNGSDVRSKDEITPEQGELIRNFLKNNASQLTFYGTMFKIDGELYLLATDQGYINQPDLVWEKLNEVNGDTLFMTGDFKEFKLDNHANNTWDEHNAVASTADYLASIDTASQAGLDINSDLQLAIALQQQEFEQQPQRHNSQQPSVGGGSRLVTGPQSIRVL